MRNNGLGVLGIANARIQAETVGCIECALRKKGPAIAFRIVVLDWRNEILIEVCFEFDCFVKVESPENSVKSAI